jgi:haloalkane dehalogenase
MNPQAAFPYESKYVSVKGSKIHYVEAGDKDPAVLLVHGIPVNAYLWRNVIPHISPVARTVAVDLIGFGKSDKPTNIEYNLPTYSDYLKGTIEALNLKSIVIVAMDLGLLTGLNYAMQNKADIRGIVMFEGFFQPMDFAFYNLPFAGRFMLKMMRKDKFAERSIVKNPKAVDGMIKMNTFRKLAEEEMAAYHEPLNDPEVRKRVWMNGVGPRVIGPKSERPGDTVDLINRYAEKLRESPIPKLLLYGKPGAAVSMRAVTRAQSDIANLEVKFIGKGKHFLPEDQPENIGKAIADFCLGLNKGAC